MERALINIINQVGVNINDAIRNPYKAEMLKYVCGLGPRKVDVLLKILRFDHIQRQNDIESQKSHSSEKQHLMLGRYYIYFYIIYYLLRMNKI